MDALARAIARPQRVDGLAARSPLEGLSRRSLGFVDVLAQSVSAVSPAGAAFTTPLLVSSVAGGASLGAIALALVLVWLTAGTINEFARRMAAAGSLYTFVARGLGFRAGVLAGVGLALGYGFIAMFAFAGTGYYLAVLADRLAPGAFDPVLLGAGAILCLGAVAALLLARGIRISARVTLLVEAMAVGLILVLIVVLVAASARELPGLAAGLAAGEDPAGFAIAAALAISAFVGFESSAALGVEAKRPLATIPRVLRTTVLLSGVLYLGAALAQTLGFAALGGAIAGSSSPANDLAVAFGMPWAGLVLDVAIATSLFACGVASTTALVRVVFSMAREGLLPAVLGTAGRRRGAPVAALALVLPVVVLVPAVVVVAVDGIWSAMTILIIVATGGYLLAYVLACVAAPVFLHRIGELTWWPAVRASLAGLGLAAVAAVYLVSEAGGQRAAGVWAFLALAAAGGLVVAARTRARPWLRSAIGLYDSPVAHDVLGGSGDGEAHG